MPSIRGIALDPSAVALALDEGCDVARHLAEEQAHRDVREGQSDGERYDDGEDD